MWKGIGLLSSFTGRATRLLALRELAEACAVHALDLVANEGIGFSALAMLLPFLVEAFVLPICQLNFLLQLA